MATASSSGQRVLIVDDKLDNIYILIGLLEHVGFELLIGQSGQEVFELIPHALPDIILLDVMMHDMDGFEVCRRLKANEQTRDIPVIFITALSDHVDILKGFEVGAVDYITKPFQNEEVFARVKTHLAVRQLQTRLENANKMLQQRTNELEFVNKELKDFAYIVSHDLKAPLRGINQLSGWLAQDYANVIDESGQELIQLLMSRVKRMDRLIDGILAYSRAGRIPSSMELIDLAPLIREVIKSLMPPENVNIALETPFPVVPGNATQFVQIFQNLLSNALKFMDKPNGKIRLGCRDDQSRWTFWVADNGPGIAAEHYEKVFQIFQTLRSADENSQSTGIGLTIVKKIVESYGGNVWIESRLGEGSTFWWTYPQAQ